MSNVRMPVRTEREDTQITKVCVEDIYKIINRVQEALDKAYNNSEKILNSIHKIYDGFEGELIVGTGVSKPCGEDVFNEDTGNDIAFMKAKLNANIKKHNLLCRVYNEAFDLQRIIDNDLSKIDSYILSDLYDLRFYNQDYLTGIEDELGI